jgi:hypothetical protein
VKAIGSSSIGCPVDKALHLTIQLVDIVKSLRIKAFDLLIGHVLELLQLVRLVCTQALGELLPNQGDSSLIIGPPGGIILVDHCMTEDLHGECFHREVARFGLHLELGDQRII